MIFFEILGQITFWLVMLLGILVIPIGIPGTFIMVVDCLIYGWLTSFSEMTAGLLAVLFVIAVMTEAIEFFIGAATAGKYGASRQGMFGAIIGGFVGAIWMTPIMPIVGTIIGAFAGAFAGATLLEYAQTRDKEKALRVGFGAFLGTLGGKLTKIAAATAMAVIVGIRIY